MNFTVNIIETFSKFLQYDEAILNDIKKFGFTYTIYSWHFTLPTLYNFLICQSDYFYGISYHQFRKEILNSPINEQLRSLNGKIIIIDNKYKVDLTTYALCQAT